MEDEMVDEGREAYTPNEHRVSSMGLLVFLSTFAVVLFLVTLLLGAGLHESLSAVLIPVLPSAPPTATPPAMLWQEAGLVQPPLPLCARSHRVDLRSVQFGFGFHMILLMQTVMLSNALIFNRTLFIDDNECQTTDTHPQPHCNPQH